MKTKLLALLTVITVSASAQWTTVAHFNQVIDDLKSYSGNLFIGGGFTKVDGNTSYWSANYDGGNWFYQTNLIAGSGISQFEVLGSDLWCTSAMSNFSGSGPAMWDGSSWSIYGGLNESQSGLYADGTDLYVGSDFGKLMKYSSAGGSVQVGPKLAGFNKEILAITKFNGQIVVAGSFDSTGATVLNHIATWNGSSFQPLGAGLNGKIRALAVYNNELYAGGDFTSVGGASGYYIAKWNGTTWSTVGGSVSSVGAGGNGIRDLLVYGGSLYAAGDFSMIGAAHAKYIARWDGSSWTDMGFNTGTSFINAIEAYNGYIYAGTFDFTDAVLYKKAAPTGISDQAPAAIHMTAYPNPASGTMHLSVPPSFTGGDITIYDMSGREISAWQGISAITQVNTSNLGSGLYSAVATKDGQSIKTRFVVE